MRNRFVAAPVLADEPLPRFSGERPNLGSWPFPDEIHQASVNQTDSGSNSKTSASTNVGPYEATLRRGRWVFLVYKKDSEMAKNSQSVACVVAVV